MKRHLTFIVTDKHKTYPALHAHYWLRLLPQRILKELCQVCERDLSRYILFLQVSSTGLLHPQAIIRRLVLIEKPPARRVPQDKDADKVQQILGIPVMHSARPCHERLVVVLHGQDRPAEQLLPERVAYL
jgi:hypothetical protein